MIWEMIEDELHLTTRRPGEDALQRVERMSRLYYRAASQTSYKKLSKRENMLPVLTLVLMRAAQGNVCDRICKHYLASSSDILLSYHQLSQVWLHMVDCKEPEAMRAFTRMVW